MKIIIKFIVKTLSIMFIMLSVSCNSNDSEKGALEINKNKDGEITSIGPSLNNDKNGIWSFYDETGNNLEEQYFYVDNIKKVKIDPPIILKVIIDSIKNFKCLVPSNWEVIEQNSPRVLYAAKSSLNKGVIVPSYNITVTDNKSNNLSESIIKESIKELKNTYNNLEIKRDGNLIKSYIKINGVNSIVYSYLIMSNKKYYTVTCMSAESSHREYDIIFKTIMYSFSAFKGV